MFKQLFSKGNAQPPSNSPSATKPNGIQSALSATSKAFSQFFGLGDAPASALTQVALDDLEDTLIRADVGLDLAVELTDAVRADKALQEPAALKAYLHKTFTTILQQTPNPTAQEPKAGQLLILMVVGVNGAGKTTLIGKLAHRWTQQGFKVCVAAGDTFRAAAEEQLSIWAERAGADLVQRDTSDAAAVVYDAIHHAQSTGANVLIIDTAGRLQNQFNLMEELSKIKRIIEREAPAHHAYEALLVLDANTGQNGMQQAKLFAEALQLTGVALTKLDGSAKGGIILNIAHQHRLPVKWVGVGEKITDVVPFELDGFLQGLLN